MGPGILAALSTDQAALEATITPEGLVDGVATGAVAWDRVENEILPPMAQQLSSNLVDPTLWEILDTNRDGKITADELLNNFLLGPFLSAAAAQLCSRAARASLSGGRAGARR